MAEYAKRTCFQCGIRLPKPKMLAVEMSKTDREGQIVSTSDKWICPDCWQAYLLKIRHKASEISTQQRLAEEAKKTKAGRTLWAEEQERRRLENLRRREQL